MVMIKIYCDGDTFVISLESITNPIFSNTPIVCSIIGFDFDEDKQIHEWDCLNVSKEYLKIFIHIIRKEISIFSGGFIDVRSGFFLPKIHYDFFGIDIIREHILEDFVKNYDLSVFDKQEFYINNCKITLNEIIDAILPKYYCNGILFKKENKVYENIYILNAELKNFYDKYLEIRRGSHIPSRPSPNDISHVLRGCDISEFHLDINIQYKYDYNDEDDDTCFALPWEIIANIERMDLSKFNLLSKYDIFSENNLDTLKKSLLDYKDIYDIINKINEDRQVYIKDY